MVGRARAQVDRPAGALGDQGQQEYTQLQILAAFRVLSERLGKAEVRCPATRTTSEQGHSNLAGYLLIRWRLGWVVRVRPATVLCEVGLRLEV